MFLNNVGSDDGSTLKLKLVILLFVTDVIGWNSRWRLPFLGCDAMQSDYIDISEDSFTTCCLP
jgi:hypothetical protein